MANEPEEGHFPEEEEGGPVKSFLEHLEDFRWALIKSGFSRGIEARPRSPSKIVKREKGIWQRRYWEHAIRDEADLERHIDYVHFNPVKHGHVSRVADWRHSSFHRFVEQGLLGVDWGGDMKEITGSFGE